MAVKKAKTKALSKTVVVDGLPWQEKFLDDGSSGWFELVGKFGELAVEEAHGNTGTFSASWWPPHIRSGEPVLINRGYSSREEAMRGAVGYLKDLTSIFQSEPLS